MGFVADALTATIFSLGLATEQRTVRSFNKLLWLQNDLITRTIRSDECRRRRPDPSGDC
jgi:hypothetical protein